MPGGHAQGHARIEAHMRLIGDERVGFEARVEAQVGHHEGRIGGQCVRAERNRAGRLAQVHPDVGLEKLPVLIEQGNERNGRVEQLGGQAGNAVETRLWRGIEEAVGV